MSSWIVADNKRSNRCKNCSVPVGADPWQRVHGMWALERLGGLDDTLVSELAGDSDAAVRVHAIKLLGERAWEKSPLVNAALSDSDPFVRRAAADALARHPQADNVKPLLDAVGVRRRQTTRI